LVIAELVMGTLAGYPHAPQLETRILHSAIFNLHPIPPKTAGPSKRTIFDFQSIPPENGGSAFQNPAYRRNLPSRTSSFGTRMLVPPQRRNGTKSGRRTTRAIFNLESSIYNLPTIKTPLPGGSWWQRGKFIEEVIPAIIVLG